MSPQALTQDTSVIVQAVKDSDIVEVKDDGSKLRPRSRPEYWPLTEAAFESLTARGPNPAQTSTTAAPSQTAATSQQQQQPDPAQTRSSPVTTATLNPFVPEFVPTSALQQQNVPKSSVNPLGDETPTANKDPWVEVKRGRGKEERRSGGGGVNPPHREHSSMSESAVSILASDLMVVGGGGGNNDSGFPTSPSEYWAPHLHLPPPPMPLFHVPNTMGRKGQFGPYWNRM